MHEINIDTTIRVTSSGKSRVVKEGIRAIYEMHRLSFVYCHEHCAGSR